MSIKVSILVPVYGVEKYIERCARSLFEQSYNDLTYIFIDDCTPDNSIGVLKKVIEDYPDRKKSVKIIRHDQNRGLASARNTAVDICNTEFLFHVDSDDYIDHNVISDCVNNVRETNADIVSVSIIRKKKGKSIIYQEDWNYDIHEIVKRLIRHEIGNGVCGRLIKTSLYKDYNIKVEVGRGMSEDLQVSPRLFYYANKATYINSCHYYYFLDNEGSYTASFNIKKHNDAQQAMDVLKNFFSNKGDDFLDAIAERRYKSIAKDIIACALSESDINTYQVLRKELKDLPDKRNLLRVPTRIAININNYYLLRWYVFFAYKMKSLIHFLKI